jgi:RecA-family ATPase
MAKSTLASMNYVYKGVHIDKVNEGSYMKRPDIVVKYSVNFNGVTCYFKTQDDVKAFIDKVTN